MFPIFYAYISWVNLILHVYTVRAIQEAHLEPPYRFDKIRNFTMSSNGSLFWSCCMCNYIAYIDHMYGGFLLCSH